MNNINIEGYNLEDIRNCKKNLKVNEVMIGTSSESYIASVKNNDSEEYINFSDEIVKSFFRDCYLEKNNTVTLIMKTSKAHLINGADLTHLVSNIWYSVLSNYLPLDRFGSKIRTLDNKCVADFVSDTSHADYNVTIGYINIGNEFNIPEYDSLLLNRDVKEKCNIDSSEFNKIYDNVFNYIEEFLGEV